MKAEFSLGICFSNNDPKNLGRIRVIPIEILGKFATLSQILEYVKQEDLKSENSLRYRPWYVTKTQNYKEKDPFLCEPFLPKILNTTPLSGQLVKIIKYDNETQKNEFIGPYTIDQVTLTEEYRNVINNFEKNINLNQVVPKKNKPFVSGYNNEQIILGDNEVIIRLNHIDRNNKNRKNSYPFIQLSQFNNSYKSVEKSVEINNTPDVPIDHICQLFISYTQTTSPIKKFRGVLVLSNTTKTTNSQGKIGLTQKTYEPNRLYFDDNTENYIVKHVFECVNHKEFISIVDDILVSYDNGSVVKYFDINDPTSTQTTLFFHTNKNVTITTYNNIPITPNSGGALNPVNIVPGLKNWVFQLKPNTQLSDFISGEPVLNDDRELNNLIIKYNNTINYGLLNNIQQTTIVTTEIVPEATDTPQSVKITYCDKFVYLSSLKSLNIVNNFDFDGIPSQTVSEILNSSKPNVRSYGFVRGEKLMEFLLEMLDMLAKHGHEIGKDPRGSIIQSTQEQIDALKKRIKDELKENQNNVIINHNFRTD